MTEAAEQMLLKRMKNVEKVLSKVHQDVDYFASKMCKEVKNPSNTLEKLRKMFKKRAECLIVDCDLLAENSDNVQAMLAHYSGIKYQSPNAEEILRRLGPRANHLCEEYNRFVEGDFHIIRALVHRMLNYKGKALTKEELDVLMVKKTICKKSSLSGLVELNKERRLVFSNTPEFITVAPNSTSRPRQSART